MDVWFTKMNRTDHERTGKAYFMYGSGLIAVPVHSVNEFAKLRSEHHAAEVRKGLMLALARKPA